MSRRKTIGMVGARGHVGTELIALITHHPALELTFVASREREGQRVSQHSDTYAGTLRYQFPDPSTVAAKALDVVILALPNGKATTYIQAIDATAPGTLVVDLSADYRFDQDWYYGLPEITRSYWQGQRRISNPGCYATAIALSIRPLKDLLVAPPVCFGVSGYSGAGTTPSDKNDPHKLRDNLIPYALTHHGHEKEAGFQLGLPVEFIPHVGSHFRGLMVTSNLYLGQPLKREAVMERFQRTYDGEPLVQIMDEVPWVSHIAHKHHARIGGFGLSTDHKRVVVVAVLDNLLKGAATQAMQNINRALGMDEYTGIPIHPTGR